MLNVNKRKLKHYVRSAIRNDEVIVMLQPKYDINNNSYCGAEALARWMFQQEEFIYPSEFISKLEKNGYMYEFDLYVLRNVCRYLNYWSKENLNLLPVSINLSKIDILKKDFYRKINNIVDEYNVDRRLLEFEITETSVINDFNKVISFTNELKKNNYSIAIDDFGKGYSSLKMISKIPFDKLKIDKYFVDSLSATANNEKGKVIIKNIINLAKELNIEVVAEGVEEECQINELKKMGCDIIQGYYYSKPILIEEFKNFLTKPKIT